MNESAGSMASSHCEPDDVVRGADPTIEGGWSKIPGYRAWCRGCKWTATFAYAFEANDAQVQHRELAHPAHRNSDLTCHAAPRP